MFKFNSTEEIYMWQQVGGYSLYVLWSLAGICVTSPTTHRCTSAMAAVHSFTCPLWESLTVGKTLAAHCRPSSGKCWSFWTRRRRRSTVHSTSIRLPASLSLTKSKENALTTSSQTFLRYISKKNFLLGQNVTLSGLEFSLSSVFVLFVSLGLVLFFIQFAQLWRRFMQVSQADPQWSPLTAKEHSTAWN